MSKPSSEPAERPAPEEPRLGLTGWLRFAWRQLTSMRTAIILLLLLALGAIPGSLVPQRSSDPNGVIQVREANPEWVWFYDAFQLHDVFGSYWFSAIYILLFVSLIGCVIPRTQHHLKALRTPPPRIPARLQKLPAYRALPAGATDADAAARTLRRLGYRVRQEERGVSAERGYLRETGNLVFHTMLMVLLIGFGIGGGFGYKGQRLVFEGYSYANALSSWDLYQPGRFFDAKDLPAYSVRLDELQVEYEQENRNGFGMPTDFAATVTITNAEGERTETLRVNQPLREQGAYLYLLSNGYAPTITVRNADGEVIFDEPVPFLAQDDNLTSLGVVKLPDGLAEQVGLRGFFYPTALQLETGAYASVYPDLIDPLLTLQVYTGDLGLDTGVPKNVFVLETDNLTEVAGRTADIPSLELRPGETVELPNGLGTVTLGETLRYAVIDTQADPGIPIVLTSALLGIAGLILSLLVPRRRVWVKVTDAGVEVAGLARGEDPALQRAVDDVAERLTSAGLADAEPAERVEPDSPSSGSVSS